MPASPEPGAPSGAVVSGAAVANTLASSTAWLAAAISPGVRLLDVVFPTCATAGPVRVSRSSGSSSSGETACDGEGWSEVLRGLLGRWGPARRADAAAVHMALALV